MMNSAGRSSRSWRVWRIVLCCLLVALLGTAGVMARRVVRLRSLVAEARTLSLDSLDDGIDLADRATAELESVYRGLCVPLWIAGRCGWVPGVGGQLAVAPEIAEQGMVLARSGNQALQIIEPWLVEQSDLQDVANLDLEGLISLVQEHQLELDACAGQARDAADTLAEIVLDDAPDSLAILKVGARYAALGLEALALAPELVGPESRTYLLLALNNHELRATGGFISAIGAVTVGPDGVDVVPFRDSYEVENWSAPHPDPPEALREHMFIDLWTTRDGNWWPDFPTSARAVADLYELNQGVEVDGVIAADLYAAQEMLETVTPLTLPTGRVVQRGEVAQVFRESWSLDPSSLRTDGVVVTATHDYVAVEVGVQLPATEGQVWFDDVTLTRLDDDVSPVVVNASFEDAGKNGLPGGWQSVGLGALDGIVDDRSLAGQRSLTINGDGETLKRVWQRLEVVGTGGTAWRMSAESAARGVPNGYRDYALTVDFVAEDGTRDRHRATYAAFTHDWASAGSHAILGEWWRHRKDVIGEAMAAVALKAMAEPSSINWPLVSLRAEQMLDERHVQVAFLDDEVAGWMAGYGWDGALRQTEADYLLVVDSNVGFNKVTLSVEQSLDYAVQAYAAGGPISDLKLVYHNTSAPDDAPCDKTTQYAPTYDQLTQGCYWDFVRVYVPAGSTLLAVHESQKVVEQHDEGAFTVFSTGLFIPPGQTTTLHFTYKQPPYKCDYGLNLVKQAGVAEMAASVRVLDVPHGWREIWTPPRWVDGGGAGHPVALRRDAILRIVTQ